MGIEIVDGDIFESEAHALVNPVNCYGVMGAGLAREFKRRFKQNTKAYEMACKNKQLQIGTPFFFRNKSGVWIINFPTKNHWMDDSKLEDIHTGIRSMLHQLRGHPGIKTVAMPALGCGLGGLPWGKVRLTLRILLRSSEVEFEVYRPKE